MVLGELRLSQQHEWSGVDGHVQTRAPSAPTHAREQGLERTQKVRRIVSPVELACPAPEAQAAICITVL